MATNKEQIKKRFQRAALSYDRQAIIQHQVAQHLVTLLERAGCEQPGMILEIGCGTGLLSQRLAQRYPAVREIYLNDLVAEVAQQAGTRLTAHGVRVTLLAGDAETMTLPAGLDLVVSASTLHWLHDLPQFFAGVHQALRPGGYLAFAMYGPDNLREIRELTGVGLAYPTLAEVKAMLAQRYFVQDCAEQRERLHFPDPRALLEHLRATGVNSLPGQVWTKNRLAEFSRSYQERFSDAQGVHLTYHPLYFIARPKRLAA